METREILFSARDLSERISSLGREISCDYKGEEIILIGVLKGVFIFLAELVRALDLPVKIDFIQISSYPTGTVPASEPLLKRVPAIDIEDQHVILVEDIADTGKTLASARAELLKRHPRSLKTCALLDKPSRRQVAITLDYRGFEIADRFVVGFGLDHDERHRNLPYIVAID